MSRKLFYSLSADAENHDVYLSFLKGMELYESERQEKMIIRIYRKIHNDFIFGVDYREFFDSIDYEEGEVIFEGRLDEFNNREYVYIDKNVDIGKTYSYWVSSTRGDLPVGPATVKVRDTKVWWPYDRVENFMEELAEIYSVRVLKKKYGTTTMKKEINGVVAGNPHNLISFIGLIHAGESGPELILPVLERLLKKDGEILNKVGVAVLPSVNADERERLVRGIPYYLRTNPNGVDINRNFDAYWHDIENTYGMDTSKYGSATYRGMYPESEEETRAVVSFVTNVKPRAIFSFHWLASICDDRFIASKCAETDMEYISKCEKIKSAYSKGFKNTGHDVEKVIYHCTAGSLPSWAYKKFRVPCFDLEHADNEEGIISRTDQTTYELLRLYQDRHYNGIKEVLNCFL